MPRGYRSTEWITWKRLIKNNLQNTIEIDAIKRPYINRVFYFCGVIIKTRTPYHLFFLPFILALMLLVPKQGRAQYYSLGSDPTSIRWSQTRINGFKLIYPTRETHLAAKYISVLNDIGDLITSSMKSEIRNLPVIMHPYAAFSNGSSILAPRRIELYPKQPIALETNDFASQLVIHEIRHFAQMERLNTGVTRIAGYVLGEQAQSLVLGIHVPVWLLEGDAVLTETLLSDGGRGRIAGFIQPLRSRLVDNKDLSWDRVWLGSYNEILPDEYVFGYFLTARGRMLADPLIWSDALGQIGANPFKISGLSGITRPKTGYRFSKLYVETLDWLHDFWTDPSLAVKYPEGLISLTPESTVYLNYFRPQQYSDHEVICLKKSIEQVPAFVIINSSGAEKVVVRPGTIEDAGFSYKNGTLLWSELIQDLRWENRSYSELYSYNITTAKRTRITHRQRYFSPVFNHSGDSIAVIDEQADGSSLIKILDPEDGRVLQSIPIGNSDHFSYLCWGTRPSELFAITTGSKGRKLIRIDLEKPAQEIILDAGFKDIACPAAYRNWIYFSGPAGTTQGIYRVNIKNHALELVFSHPHGINYLSVQDNYLYLSAYSSSGYRPAKIAFSSLHYKKIDQIEPLVEPVTDIIQRADGEFPIVYSDTIIPVSAKPYNKYTHLFRLHSWSPLFVNPDAYQINPGVVMMSQNDLSTLTCWAGYQYNKTDLSHNLVASARFTALYPVLEMDYSRKYRDAQPESDSTVDQSAKFPGAYQQFLRIGAGIPYRFSSGAWSRSIQPTAFLEWVNDLTDPSVVADHSAWMAGLSLSSSFLRKLSYRDLFPRWGLSMNFSYFKAFSKVEGGDNLTGRVILYMPGFLPNSSLRILNSAHLLSFGQFYNSVQDFPRGQVIYEALRRYNFKIDFAFPVSYPDYHISWLIYVKRIKADLFFDAGTPIGEKDWFMSAGLDLTFDYHLLRTGIELESGIRMMYFPTTRMPGAEFLFGFSVN